jgi:hypothetical protein
LHGLRLETLRGWVKALRAGKTLRGWVKTLRGWVKALRAGKRVKHFHRPKGFHPDAKRLHRPKGFHLQHGLSPEILGTKWLMDGLFYFYFRSF